MNTKTIVGLIGLLGVLLVLSACAPTQPQTSATPSAEPAASMPSSSAKATAPNAPATKTRTVRTVETKDQTVDITTDGFSPQTLSISAGDTVTWTNQHTVDAWPASAVHPTHTLYPGSDINKCNTAERDSLFDACQRVGQGESYSFRFYEKGSWKYHNHLNPAQTGTIVVG